MKKIISLFGVVFLGISALAAMTPVFAQETAQYDRDYRGNDRYDDNRYNDERYGRRFNRITHANGNITYNAGGLQRHA
jgi:hypothetical protein